MWNVSSFYIEVKIFMSDLYTWKAAFISFRFVPNRVYWICKIAESTEGCNSKWKGMGKNGKDEKMGGTFSGTGTDGRCGRMYGCARIKHCGWQGKCRRYGGGWKKQYGRRKHCGHRAV